MRSIPGRWRFHFVGDLDGYEGSLSDLSWPEVVLVLRAAEWGDLDAQSDDEWVTLAFNATHAAVLYTGRDRITLRPYLASRPVGCQDVSPFFEDGGIIRGHRDQYLARSFGREDGFRLFAAVLAAPTLPADLPDPHAGQPALTSLDDVVAARAVSRSIEWRPLLDERHRRA